MAAVPNGVGRVSRSPGASSASAPSPGWWMSKRWRFPRTKKSRYVKICQDMSRYVKICQDMSRYVKICQDMSRYTKLIKVFISLRIFIESGSWMLVVQIPWKNWWVKLKWRVPGSEESSNLLVSLPKFLLHEICVFNFCLAWLQIDGRVIPETSGWVYRYSHRKLLYSSWENHGKSVFSFRVSLSDQSIPSHW